MTPDEVLERFREEEMIRMVAYQNLYGPVGPERWDYLFARLGMDVSAPHMRRGQRPKLKDHLIEWSRRAKRRKTPQEILSIVRDLQGQFERKEKR